MRTSVGAGILFIIIALLLLFSRIFRWLLLVLALLLLVIIIVSVVRFLRKDARNHPEKKAFKRFSDSIFRIIPDKKKTWDENKALKSIWFGKRVVTERSKRYAALVRLNNQYSEYAHNIVECLPFHLDNVKAFSEFNPDLQMEKHVQDNNDHYAVMLARINECREKAREYQRMYFEILQSNVEIPYPLPSGVTEASYIKKERDVITHPAMRVDFGLDVEVDIYVIMAWECKSPDKKTHYENYKTYVSADIQKMLQLANSASTNSNQYRSTETASSTQNKETNKKHDFTPEEFISSEGVNTLEGAKELLTKNYEKKTDFKSDIKYLLEQTIAFQRGTQIAKEYIDKRFPRPQMTNDKFMSSILDWENAFIGIICKASDTIAISTIHTQKIDEYLEHIKYGVVALTVKLEELLVVLINGNDTMDGFETSEEIAELVKEMQKLISEAKKYQ